MRMITLRKTGTGDGDKTKAGDWPVLLEQTVKGIVSIIDSRVGEESRAPYKQIIWDSLPIKNKTNNFEVITGILSENYHQRGYLNMRSITSDVQDFKE